MAKIVVLSDASVLAQEAAKRVVSIARAAIEGRGRFSVALSGGATPAGLYRLLALPPYCDQIDWTRVVVFFGDERCVPLDDSRSNYRLAHDALLAHVRLPKANVFRMEGELRGEEGAVRYEDLLRRQFTLQAEQRPRFDLILLGLGEDGHTASLFPGMPAAKEMRRLVVDTEVPPYAQPAVSRLTLTLPVLNEARQILFLASGDNKATAVALALGHPDPGRDIPARRVRPSHGELTWLLDTAAAHLYQD